MVRNNDAQAKQISENAKRFVQTRLRRNDYLCYVWWLLQYIALSEDINVYSDFIRPLRFASFSKFRKRHKRHSRHGNMAKVHEDDANENDSKSENCNNNSSDEDQEEDTSVDFNI